MPKIESDPSAYTIPPSALPRQLAKEGSFGHRYTWQPMVRLRIDLPDEVPAAFGMSVDELEREVRLAAAVDWYRRGLVSQGRGAEIAGMPRADFIDALAARRIDVAQVDLDSLDRDLEHA